VGPGPDRSDSGPRPLESSLDAVSERLGLGGSQVLSRLFAHWPEIVGPGMAGHGHPVRFDREALVVRVDHPAWATQVRRMGDLLLDRVAEETGAGRPARMEVRIQR
jgi:predicted nucleic acid-binding Zn ribbon protein